MKHEIIEAIPHRPEADTFDIQKSIETIKQAISCHKWLIVLTTVSTLFICIMYTVLFPANYQTHVVLMADSPKDMQRIEFYNHWNVFRKNHIPDEVELMTSGLVLGKVVDELNLGFNDVYHTFMGHVGYLWVESWIGKTYRKAKSWIFPKPPSPYQLTPEEIERGRTIDSFKEGVGVRSLPDTNMGALIVRGPTPRITEYANAIVNIYLEERKTRLMEEAQVAYDALKAEADKAQDELLALEQKIKEFYAENEMVLAYEKDKVQVTGWLSLRAAIVENEAALSAAEESLIEVERQLETEDKEVVTGRVLTKNSVRENLRSQIVQLKLALEQTRLRFNEDSPEVQEIKDQIGAVQGLWEQEKEVEQSQSTSILSETYQRLATRRSSLLAEIEGLKASLVVKKEAEKKLSQALDEIPEKMKTTRMYEREHQILEKKYVALSDKMMIAAVSKATVASAPPAIRVINYAKPPEKPYWPNKKLLFLGAIVFGVCAGIFLALLVDFIYGRVSRYRLTLANAQFEIYAIVSRDREFLDQLYHLPALEDKR